jgi:hypothetical protein
MHRLSLPIYLDSCVTAATMHMLHIEGRGVLCADREQCELLPSEASRDSLGLLGWHDDAFFPSKHLISTSETAVRLGITEPMGIIRRVIVLRVHADRLVRFWWDCGEFAGGGASEGVLQVIPTSGDILPGQSLVCQLTYHAGVETQILDGEIAVYARVLTEKEATGLGGEGALAASALPYVLLETALGSFSEVCFP